MRGALVSVSILAAVCVGGCDSGESESEHESESANAPAAQTVRDFYDAANRSSGEDACALLTRRGVRSVVHVASRPACIRTIDAFDPGSFESEEGDLVEIEGVDERGEGFDVDAVVKNRTAGTYSVVRRGGRLLIDAFKPEEG